MTIKVRELKTGRIIVFEVQQYFDEGQHRFSFATSDGYNAVINLENGKWETHSRNMITPSFSQVINRYISVLPY